MIPVQYQPSRLTCSLAKEKTVLAFICALRIK